LVKEILNISIFIIKKSLNPVAFKAKPNLDFQPGSSGFGLYFSRYYQPVPAAALGLKQSLVRSLNQGVGGISISRKKGKADRNSQLPENMAAVLDFEVPHPVKD